MSYHRPVVQQQVDDVSIVKQEPAAQAQGKAVERLDEDEGRHQPVKGKGC